MARYKLDNYITIHRLTEDYSSGDLVVTEGTEVSFWGSVDEIKSPAIESGNIYSEGRLRDKRMLKVTARYYDTEDVVIGDELSFDDFTGRYSVSDKYDKEFKHYVCLIVEQIG